MQTMMTTNRQQSRGRAPIDRLEYRIVVALAFAVCLMTGFAGRVLSALGGGAMPARPSLIREARASAHAAAGYAFIA